MDSLLISLLLSAAFSHVYPSITNEPKLWQHSTSQANSLSDASKRCICWPDALPPTAQQLLDTQNHGQERLVIYLYKNDVTNEIKMHTPSANKQLLIPDIPYEAGDGLVTVTTENVYTLLYNNPNKIKVYNDHIEKLVPLVTESLAIGLNTGAVENFYPNADNYLNPNNNYKGNEYAFTKDILVANGPSEEVVIEAENEPTAGKLIPEQNWSDNNYPYTELDSPQAIPFNPQTNADNAQTTPEDSLAILINPQSPPHVLQVTPINSKSLLPNPQAIPGNIPIALGPYKAGLKQNDVYTFPNDQASKLQPISQDVNESLTATYMTFNIWFNQQMKRFHNVHLINDIKIIDSKSLKILVQKALNEHNIYITADGVITDAKGIIIDASNLELRPLLLGGILNHQNFKNAKGIEVPKYLPYLEGILVTLISPPQVLGIIPLGKTYLSETSYQTLLLGGLTSVNGSKIYINGIANPNTASYSTGAKGTYSLAYKDIFAKGVTVAGNSNLGTYSQALPVAYSIDNKKPQLSKLNYWSSGPYHTASKMPYPTANWNPSELIGLLGPRRKMPDAVIEHHFDQPLKVTRKSEPTDLKEDITTVEPFPSINVTEPARRFAAPSISSVMKTLLFLLNDLPSRRSLNSTGVDIVEESESNDDGEAPDFRIIGGNAATGSGTPLSNKGRSGMEYAT